VAAARHGALGARRSGRRSASARRVPPPWDGHAILLCATLPGHTGGPGERDPRRGPRVDLRVATPYAFIIVPRPWRAWHVALTGGAWPAVQQFAAGRAPHHGRWLLIVATLAAIALVSKHLIASLRGSRRLLEPRVRTTRRSGSGSRTPRGGGSPSTRPSPSCSGSPPPTWWASRWPASSATRPPPARTGSRRRAGGRRGGGRPLAPSSTTPAGSPAGRCRSTTSPPAMTPRRGAARRRRAGALGRRGPRRARGGPPSCSTPSRCSRSRAACSSATRCLPASAVATARSSPPARSCPPSSASARPAVRRPRARARHAARRARAPAPRQLAQGYLLGRPGRSRRRGPASCGRPRRRWAAR
jgi:hypothetical protein